MKKPQPKALTQSSVRQAYESARQAFEELLSQYNCTNVALEEIEQTEDGKWWLITLGYDQAKKLSGIQAALADFASRIERRYKTFKVDASTGEVVAMKIRELA